MRDIQSKHFQKYLTTYLHVDLSSKIGEWKIGQITPRNIRIALTLTDIFWQNNVEKTIVISNVHKFDARQVWWGIKLVYIRND